MTPTTRKRTSSRGEEKEAKRNHKGLAEGDICPDFELETDESTPEKQLKISLKEMIKDNGIVIFIYPAANTPGCTTQANGFQENQSAIEKAGYKIYGMSADKPRSQANWKRKHKLQYNLLCDPTYEVLEKLGVLKAGKKISRSHIIIEKGGQIKSLQIGISPKISVSGALKYIQELNPSSPIHADPPAGDQEGDEKVAEKEDKSTAKGQAVDPVDDDVPPAVKEPEKVVGDPTTTDAVQKEGNPEEAEGGEGANGTPGDAPKKEDHVEEIGTTNGTT